MPQGSGATVDVLGEEIHTRGRGARDRLDVRRRARGDRATTASTRTSRVKLTGLGLKLDFGLCRSLVEELVRMPAGGALRPHRHGGRDLRRRHARALPRAARGRATTTSAIVLQAYLKRTLDDIEDLARAAAERAALQGDLRRAARDRLPRRRRRATVVRRLPRRAPRRRLPCRRLRPTTSSSWSSRSPVVDGRCRRTPTSSRCCSASARAAPPSSSRRAPVRVYVPFGRQWYEYSLRRLQENPRMAGVIAKATLGRAVGRDG